MDELKALKIALGKQLVENKKILSSLKSKVKESPELLVRCEYFIGVIKGLEIALKLIKEIEEKKMKEKGPEASKGHWVLYVGKDWEGVETIPFHQEKEPTDICELCQIPENKCRCNCCEFCGAYDWKCGDDCAWCNNHGGLKGEDCDCGQ